MNENIWAIMLIPTLSPILILAALMGLQRLEARLLPPDEVTPQAVQEFFEYASPREVEQFMATGLETVVADYWKRQGYVKH